MEEPRCYIPMMGVRFSNEVPNAPLADVVIAAVWRAVEVGSIPTGCTKNMWERSSSGRATDWKSVCGWFESGRSYHNALLDKLVKSSLSKGEVLPVRIGGRVPKFSRCRLMVRTLIKGYPVKDTVSILKIPCQGRDPGSNPGCGASLG